MVLGPGGCEEQLPSNNILPSQQLIDDSCIFARLCQDLAEQLTIRFIDAGKWNISLAYDGVHFTEQGHKTFAAGLLEELK